MLTLLITAALAFGFTLTFVGWLPLMIEKIVRRVVGAFVS